LARRKKGPDAPVEGAARPVLIRPGEVYTYESARAALGLKRDCLPREVQLGRLEGRVRANKGWILGRWLLEWLIGGRSARRQGAAGKADDAADSKAQILTPEAADAEQPRGARG